MAQGPRGPPAFDLQAWAKPAQGQPLAATVERPEEPQAAAAQLALAEASRREEALLAKVPQGPELQGLDLVPGPEQRGSAQERVQQSAPRERATLQAVQQRLPELAADSVAAMAPLPVRLMVAMARGGPRAPAGQRRAAY